MPYPANIAMVETSIIFLKIRPDGLLYKLTPRTIKFSWAVYVLVLVMPLLVFWPLAGPIAPNVFWMYVAPGIYLTDLAVMAVLMIGQYKRIRQGPAPPANRAQKTLTILLLAISLLGLLTAPFALSRPLAIYSASRWLLAFALYWTLAQSELPIENVIRVLVAGLCLNALVGIAQFITRGPLGLPGELALAVDQDGAARIAAGGVRWLRAYGLTFHPNVLGGFLMIGLILSLALKKHWSVYLIWGLLGVGLLLTFSRSAWLGSLVAIPLAVLGLSRRQHFPKRMLVGGLSGLSILGIMTVIFLWSPITTRLNPLSSFAEYTSLSRRGELIRVAVKSIWENPLVGIGAANFPLAVIEAQSPATAHSVHNVALMLAAEVGVFGGLLWCLLWIFPLIYLAQAPRRDRPWSFVLLAAWFALGIVSLWDFYPWGLESGRLLTVSLAAIIYQSMGTAT